MLKTGSRFKFLCDTKELPSFAVANEVAEAVDSSLSTATNERSQCDDLGWQGDDDRRGSSVASIINFIIGTLLSLQQHNYYYYNEPSIVDIIVIRLLLLNNNTKRMDGNKPLRLEMGEIELKTGFVPLLFLLFIKFYI